LPEQFDLEHPFFLSYVVGKDLEGDFEFSNDSVARFASFLSPLDLFTAYNNPNRRLMTVQSTFLRPSPAIFWEEAHLSKAKERREHHEHHASARISHWKEFPKELPSKPGFT
jgi:hypothetical protein